MIHDARSKPSCDIAIVGLAGRFPGAANLHEFWQNLCDGVESITHFAQTELEDAFSAQVRAESDFVRARSVLDDVEFFDAAFFGMQAREAELTDPQHRVFLECCWEALENAGYDPGSYSGSIGVFAGCSINTYFLRNVLHNRTVVAEFTSNYQVASYAELLGAGHDFLATRVAYKLNLRGPATTLQSACSTSLNAIAQACQTLLTGQADMMLAGAVSITFPQRRGYRYQTGGMVSSDGHCRTFDAEASGTVFGSGAGVIVLKRIEDAIADGDTIFAKIRGFGVNNDGSAKAGFSAPSVNGQARAISTAQAMANVMPSEISFVECHGTATPLGDPIEFAALAQVFGRSSSSDKHCAIGSVKTNVGHLDVAAGMSSIIKTIFCLQNRQIPPTLNYSKPNPQIDLEHSPFFINTKLIDWPGVGERRLAGVSAFGIGGTNAHLVLEAGPERSPQPSSSAQLLVLSARTPAALEAACGRLVDFLQDSASADLSAVAFTLQVGRRAFRHRLALVAATPADAVSKLRASRQTRASVCGKASEDHLVAFMFPGQGSQFTGMGRELYAQVPVFRDSIDRCAAILEPMIGADLRRVLYALDDEDGSLTPTALAQPAIFAVQYALAQVWISWGIVPGAMIGHSVGEFVAACLAGVMTLRDALFCVAERGKLMGAADKGAMLGVRLSPTELEPLLEADVAVGAVNAPRLCVVAGSYDGIIALERRLSERGALYRRLDTSHAFHSWMMDEVVEPLASCIATVPLAEPQVPYVSTVTGDWITPQDATSAGYWARHCRQPVLFADALHVLVDGGATILLEVGPGNALAAFARQGAGKDRCTILGSLPGKSRERGEFETMLDSLGTIWVAGIEPDWRALHTSQMPGRVPLPTYPFERKRFWASGSSPDAADDAPVDAVHSQLETNTVASRASQQLTAEISDASRREIVGRVALMLEELSGEDIGAADASSSFLALGFDSLSLGRFATQIQSQFGVKVTFRQLLSDIPSIAALADHILTQQPLREVPLVREAAEPPPATQPARAPVEPLSAITVPISRTPRSTNVEVFMRDQLAVMQQLMREQLAVLVSPNASFADIVLAPEKASGPAQPIAAPSPAQEPATSTTVQTPPTAASDAPSRFDVFRSGATNAPPSELTARQRAHIEQLVTRTTSRTRRSKENTQGSRAVLADPRVAAGFRSEWKEMVYPITCARAKGSRLWDVDGNEYIDLLNGFGQTAFGHAPDFVVEAVHAQLERGFPIGPQTELAGEVAALFCELTGNERVTFCNTGSEAVMAALRVARTVTGRDRVVVFNGAYHGQFDEVLVKGARTSHRALPVAPGIPAQSVANITVLPYGTPESIAWIREHAGELAAVVAEPVQSRHPALQPKEFLTELRAITQTSGTALVFDEVVTGFRVHTGGMQTVFDIRADLATYGKVVGGGMPIGILAGNARFMDALDGGMWQYGDDSIPEVAPTFFAGTFVRHPLVMAAVLAVLKHLKACGPALQTSLTELTAELVGRLNAELQRRGLKSRIETFASFFYFNFTAEERLAGLLYYHMRNRGVYLQEGFPCFLTTAHTAADVEHIVEAFGASLTELAANGIFEGSAIDPDDSVPLTEEQTEIWLAAQFGDDASCAFNESITMRLEGAFDESAFASAWNGLLRRHDVLRSRLSPTGETLFISPDLDLTYRSTDLTRLSDEQAAAIVEGAIAREARLPFDMFAGPLVRGELFRRSATAHIFVFTAHHIVCDGWSMNVLLGEFTQLYGEFADREPSQLPRPLAFRTYARRQLQRDPVETARIESFWLKQFVDPVAPLDLPLDRPRPPIKSFNGATCRTYVATDQYRRIKQAGARNGCTLFVTLLAAYATLVGRLAEQSDVVVGVPAAGQSLLEDEILVGHCVDFLPIRTRWTAEATLADVLKAAKRSVLDAFEHQSYTLGTLVRKLDIVRETNRLPLTEIQFNLERFAEGLETSNLRINVEPNPKAFVNYDLFLNVIESEAGLRLDCDFNTDLFDTATIERWLKSYQVVLEAIADDVTMPVAMVSFLTPAERQNVIVDVNANAGVGFGDVTVHATFEERAARQPEALAVTSDSTTLTYGDLNRKANQLANYLRSRVAGVGLPIGICTERSADALVAFIAVLKAGHAFVPLDPAHPPARRRHVADDSALAAILTDGSGGDDLTDRRLAEVHLVRDAAVISACSSSGPDVPHDPDSLAYILYTSGSTGRPKGVEVTHRSVVNALYSISHQVGLTATDVLMAVATFSFDMAMYELFAPLAAGAHIVIASSDTIRNPSALIDLISSRRVTSMQATPSLWQIMVEAGFESGPGFTMLSAGEPLQRALADRLLAGGGSLWNGYGPTETTILSACGRIFNDGSPICAGRPVLNTQLYILDSNGQPVPAGQSGELHIGGVGVTRGYVRQPALTAEKFVANPFAAGRMYRTGDLARLLPTGEFQILGRLDDQVKLHGYRIELGEIESVMMQHAQVAAAAVMRREDDPGDVRLVAYFVEKPEWPRTPDELRALLSAHLPDYMLPTKWVRLAAMPVSANGKLDRTALPAPDRSPTVIDDYAAPQTPTERALADIWAATLGLEQVSTRDDIFALGADSIHIFRITARANKQDLPLSAKQLIRHRTIGEIAREIDATRAAQTNGPDHLRPIPLRPLTFGGISDASLRGA